jgi:hypothetical protein
MKKIFTLSLAVIFGAAAMAQTSSRPDEDNYGVVRSTDKKYYIKDGKIYDRPLSKENNKSASDKKLYVDYFLTELDGYALGDDNQIKRFYSQMHDSARTLIGTAFTHIFDASTFEVFGFDSIGKTDNVQYINIDSVIFNMGHKNHSGLDNQLILTLKTLPLGGGPSQTGTVIWTETITSKDFTPGLEIGFLPEFSVPVGITLPYTNRGVYFEMAFKGQYPQDSASCLINSWDSKITCAALPTITGSVESWTLREAGLSQSRIYFQDPHWAMRVGAADPQRIWSGFEAYIDCNGSASYERNTNEASQTQNYSMGVHMTYGGDFFGVNDYNNDLSKLSQNYPNPFSSTTTIDYTLVNASNVSIEVFDITGKSVTLVSEGYKSAGTHQVTLDATNLNNGIYYYSFKTDAGQVTKKMVVKH